MRDQQPEASGERHYLIALFFLAWMVAIIWRLADLQITRRGEFVALARSQQTRTSDLKPLRGTIVDRSGRELAATIDPDTVVADLYKIGSKDEQRAASEKTRIAATLAPLLGEKPDVLLAKLNGPHKLPVLKRRVDVITSQKIEQAIKDCALPGVQLVKEVQRYYPNGSLAAQLLGFVNAENRGVAGLEMRHDDVLTGKPGQRVEETDARGTAHLRRDSAPIDGARIETTIDLALQHQVEAAIGVALEETQARGISAVVMEPQTGEILALANAPSFDPNARMRADEDFARRNRAVSDTYEPGSVFKLVTYAAAIEEKLAKPDEKIDCRSITIGSRVKQDDHPGVYTVAEALAKSSNVGAMRLAQRIVRERGKERLADYIRRFGFGEKTGVDLPAEASGHVKPVSRWQEISLGSIPVGYEVTITPLQAVAAMAAIANGGVWVQPHVVRRIVTGDGGVIEAAPKIHRVISEQAARTVTSMLEEVVTSGTAKRAMQFGGYRAAGKTGTAYKVDPETHRYSKTKFMATFVGFVPVERPRFAIIVTVDEPKGLHQGGQVAAPVFSHIAEAALGDYGVLPETEEHRQAIEKFAEAYRAKLREGGDATSDAVLPDESSDAVEENVPKEIKRGSEEVVANARPARRQDKPRRNEIAVAGAPDRRTMQQRAEAALKEGAVVVPDLRGRGLREVIGTLSRLQLQPKVSGAGLAVRQSPAPGTRVKAGEVCVVEFR